MPFVALVDNVEVELQDAAAVAEALRAGRISPETWIADVDVEADWETVEEKFPALCGPGGA
ncbi:hypothetical protein ACXR0O_03230 [Verrucomicrobiota bacterium sgz303538]